MKEDAGNEVSLSLWKLYEGNMEGAPILGTLKDILSKALEMGVCIHKGPVLGNMGGCSFPRVFERRIKFLSSGGLLL
jgi:hypothetical protein